jgi:hypothetical protein
MATRKLEMREGPEAWERFLKAMEAIVSLRKGDLPPKRELTKPKAKPPTKQ